jgi:hypothetical protein
MFGVWRFGGETPPGQPAGRQRSVASRFDGLLQRQLAVLDLVDDDAFADRIAIRVEGDDAGDDGELFRRGDGVTESARVNLGPARRMASARRRVVS